MLHGNTWKLPPLRLLFGSFYWGMHQSIFWVSLIIPEDWKNANIVPIFKKWDRSKPSNYRPVSLTSVASKILEHIIVSQRCWHTYLLTQLYVKVDISLTCMWKTFAWPLYFIMERGDGAHELIAEYTIYIIIYKMKNIYSTQSQQLKNIIEKW
jgi:hypothetical protein